MPLAQLDVHQTGDQEIADLTLAGLATFFHEDWSWNISKVFLFLLLFQEGQLQVSGERMCTILVNHLED